MAKAKDSQVFNIKKRWLRRTYIPSAELYSSVLVIGIAAITGIWFINQQDNYDHNERDLDPNLLSQHATLELYTRPLKLWQEPGSTLGPAAGPAIAPYPAATLDPQWQLAGRVRTFGPDNLFEKINGEAEKFLKLNFQQMHYLVLKSANSREEIAIELYDHGDVMNSIGIFSGHTSPNKEILKAGNVTYFETGAGMIGRRGKYFFRVAATAFDDPIKSKVTQLAESFSQLGESQSVAVVTTVAAEPEEEAMPLEFQVLNNNLQISEDAIAFAGQNVFQFDFASNFWFGAFGDDGDGPESRAFIHVAESEQAAQELYQQLLVEFEFDYKVSPFAEGDAQDNAVVMKHRFLNTFLVMQHKGPYLFGAENLADQNRVPQLMSQFIEGIGSEGSNEGIDDRS